MAVYLIHFERHIGGEGRNGATHYVGYADDVTRRMAEHEAGRGAAILRFCRENGIGWQVVRVWHDADRSIERKIKDGGQFATLCPCCAGERSVQRRTYGHRCTIAAVA